MKRLVLCLLTLCLVLSLVPAAFATEVSEATEETEATRPADACGESLTWSFYEGTLTVTGVGTMDDMSGGAPWDAYKKDITSLVLTGGVTTVGAEAFAGCDNLVSIDFGGSLREIDTGAFRDCDGLTSIRLPVSFRRFGKECFQNCANLTEVHCAGGMPSFNANCLWNGNYVTVYCPVDNIWPETYVQELEHNFGGRLEILAEDGTDPFHFEEDTEEAEEETTAATTEPATEPTEEATAATTEATEEFAVPTTEATEAPTTEAAAEETEEFVEFTEPDKEKTGGAAGIAIGVMAVSAIGIGVILYALKTGGKKGGKYQA